MSPLDTVNEFIRKVVGNDLDAACALVSDDVEYDNVPIGKNIGPDAIKALLTGMFGPFDGVEFIVHREAATGNIVMNERTDRFHQGDRSFDIDVTGVFELNADGKIELWRDYFDLGAAADILAALNG